MGESNEPLQYSFLVFTFMPSPILTHQTSHPPLVEPITRLPLPVSLGFKPRVGVCDP